MQPLKQPTKLAGRLDRIGLRVLILGLSVGWFVLLWGRLGPAALAGCALAALWYLALRLGEKRTLAARESSLRRRIGGELAVDSLLMQSAQSAAVNAASWLSTCLPLTDFEQVSDGVLARSEGRRVYVCCVRRHPAAPAGRDEVLQAARHAMGHGAEVCVVCATCRFSAEAVLLAEELRPRTRLLGREGLARIAGSVAPATNEQLQELGKRQRRRGFDVGLWKARLIQPAKARRYGAYGLGMMGFLVVTRQWVYLLPSVICLGLFFLCKRQTGKAFEL